METKDKTRIRASQGHSIDINLDLIPQQPPEFLYHGTAQNNVESILEKGIEKRNRQHVHLSIDKEAATSVGMRHGKPIILTIRTGKMFEDGVLFYLSENGVWLTDFCGCKIYFEMTDREFVDKIKDFPPEKEDLNTKVDDLLGQGAGKVPLIHFIIEHKKMYIIRSIEDY